MNRREQLRFHADRFLAYINKSDVDPEKLSSMLAIDLVTPLTYPGAVSGFAGVKSIVEKLHSALSNYKLSILAPVIDEEECRVVFFVKSSGVQTGYCPFPPGKTVVVGSELMISEWRGFPGSGNFFDHFGFVMMKVCHP